MVIDGKLSDFHKMEVTVTEMYHSKQKPTILNLDFSNEGFIMDFKALL